MFAESKAVEIPVRVFALELLTKLFLKVTFYLSHTVLAPAYICRAYFLPCS